MVTPHIQQPRFRADNVRPVRNTFSKPPAFLVQTAIGKEGNLFTKVKIWIHAPTIEFPKVGVFISFNNGAGSSFAKLAGLRELQEFAEWLNKTAVDAASVYPQLQAQEAVIDATTLQYKQQMELLRQLQTMQPTEEEPQYLDSEVP